MQSPTGWPEVPCAECGEFVRGIGFGERCADCLKRRRARASRVAQRVALIATAMTALWVLAQPPASSMGRWYAGFSVALTYVLVRTIVSRVAMEVMK